MPRATAVTRRAAVKAERITDTITLDHRARALSAGTIVADSGAAIELALAAPTQVNDGDALRLEDDALVQVRAAAEAVLEIRAENPARLLRAALLAGGAHAEAQAEADVLYIQADEAVAEAIRGLGCSVTATQRPFSPERLAVHDCCGHDHGHHHHAHGHGHGHAHDHAHDHAGECGCGAKHAHSHGHSHEHAHHHGHHGHEHAHGQAHEHSHEHAHNHGGQHDHGAGCGCGHDHHARHDHTDHKQTHGQNHGHHGHDR